MLTDPWTARFHLKDAITAAKHCAIDHPELSMGIAGLVTTVQELQEQVASLQRELQGIKHRR